MKIFLKYVDTLRPLWYILVAETHTLNADVTRRSNPYFDTRAFFALLAAGRSPLPAVSFFQKKTERGRTCIACGADDTAGGIPAEPALGSSSGRPPCTRTRDPQPEI